MGMSRHHTEKHQPEASWEDKNVGTSEGKKTDGLASLETKECSAQAYGLERHVTEESSDADNSPELRVEDDDELRIEDENEDELRIEDVENRDIPGQLISSTKQTEKVEHVRHVSPVRQAEPLSALPLQTTR